MASASEMNSAVDQLEDTPVDEFGKPMIQISCASGESSITRDNIKINIGPVVVKRWVIDDSDDTLRQEIRKTQALCEEAISEDRQTIASMVRL